VDAYHRFSTIFELDAAACAMFRGVLKHCILHYMHSEPSTSVSPGSGHVDTIDIRSSTVLGTYTLSTHVTPTAHIPKSNEQSSFIPHPIGFAIGLQRSKEAPREAVLTREKRLSTVHFFSFELLPKYGSGSFKHAAWHMCAGYIHTRYMYSTRYSTP
jgi:hypothetical protein